MQDRELWRRHIRASTLKLSEVIQLKLSLQKCNATKYLLHLCFFHDLDFSCLDSVLPWQSVNSVSNLCTPLQPPSEIKPNLYLIICLNK